MDPELWLNTHTQTQNTLVQGVNNFTFLSGRGFVLRNIKTHTRTCQYTKMRGRYKLRQIYCTRKRELWRKAAVARVLWRLCTGSSAAGPDMWPGSRPIRNQTAGEEKQEKPLVSCLLRVFAQPATSLSHEILLDHSWAGGYLPFAEPGFKHRREKLCFVSEQQNNKRRFCCQVRLDTLMTCKQHGINTTQW